MPGGQMPEPTGPGICPSRHLSAPGICPSRHLSYQAFVFRGICLLTVEMGGETG